MRVVRSAWVTPRNNLLSAAGVEWALAGGVAILKVMNVTQAGATIALAPARFGRPWVELGAFAFLAVSGLQLVVISLRARRLVPRAVAVDAVVAVGVLVTAPLFQPAPGVARWTDWPIAVSFLAAAAAVVTLSRVPAVCTLLALLAGAASWTLWAPGAVDVRRMALTSWVPYIGFAVGGALFAHYLRRLAQLADERAAEIRRLEQERTRRLLHTPYRLLNELTILLLGKASGQGGDDDGVDELRRARLAEALASIREIEAVVRGTELASSRLADDLRRLEEQFLDLPLVLAVDDAVAELPPTVVYRAREAVRSLLQNVRLHADAGEVVVYARSRADGWLVSVHDDGRGFDPAVTRYGVGLRDSVIGALREVGAAAEITSRPGEGTLVELRGGPASVVSLADQERAASAQTSR